MAGPAPGCDFCSVVETPAWAYPCADFLMDQSGGVDHVSTGAWLACDSCAMLIEAEAWSALAERAASIHVQSHPETRRQWAATKERIAELHREFRKYRGGDRVGFG